MPLSAGQKLGPYEILTPIGAGGMGQVYKARDTRLDRIVAIKVLPADKVADPEQKQRFRQEAKAASSLNHPNIITIYDIGSENGIDYLAMEFVAGETLDRLTPRNGMRIGDLLATAAQVADGLAGAHQAGIVHRDLKPSNVMVSSGGLVKVLDFGLAKLMQSAAGEAAETKTIAALTSDGAILGTAYYMSPEQAEAKPLDARSDIFSFGVMLYEMATGQRPFQGQSQTAVLAAILREEPKAVGVLRVDLPGDLTRLITRCLRKDPARRFQHMDDLKVALEELKEESDSGKLSASVAGTNIAAAKPSGKKRIWIAAAATLLIGTAIAGWRLNRGALSATDAPPTPIPLTSYRGTESNASFSPDGNQVAFSWDGEKENVFDVYVKLIGPGGPLRLTNGPENSVDPKWSPSGSAIAFVRRSSEEKFSVIVVPALGGPERKIGSYASRNAGGALPLSTICWTADSKALIVSASPAPGQPNQLVLVSLETGETRALTHPPPQIEGDTRPAISPDGRALVFVRTNGSFYDLWRQALGDGFQPQGEPKQVPLGELGAGSMAWMPDSRELLFSTAAANASIYRMPASGAAPPQLVPGIGAGAAFPAVSLQGHRLVYSAGTRDTDIWKVDLRAKSAAVDEGLSSTYREVFPQYSPDGKRVTFYSNRAGRLDIWVANADGSQAARLTSLAGPTTGSPRWSPDGQEISFDSNTGGAFQIYTVSADGGQPRKLTKDAFTNITTNWSHDGRWIYFASKRSGDFQIWKMPAQGGEAVQVTHNGGVAPTESPDGKTLYFTKDSGSSGLWKMPVEGGPETKMVADLHRYNYAVTDKGIYFTPDGTRDRSASVQFLDFTTGIATQIVKVQKALDLGITVSPDGRTLLFAQIGSAGRNLMLVENFR
ncbi:MAG TPA: protein kinase [Bryobacteraceae bacterium]|jgi:serine/threonine protein kinase|nr:protein kinase [Bryobacteraceae bacterium]